MKKLRSHRSLSAVISIVRARVERACRKKTNIYGYNAWDPHIKSVVYYGKILAKKTGANEDVVTLAALLHDYAATVDKAYIAEHHIHGARLAEELLTSFNVSPDIIQNVCECILTHRGSKVMKKKTKEAQCVADADAMSHFSSISSLFTLALVVHKLSTEEARKFVLEKLMRSFKKLSPPARRVIQPKFDAVKILLKSWTDADDDT